MCRPHLFEQIVLEVNLYVDNVSGWQAHSLAGSMAPRSKLYLGSD